MSGIWGRFSSPLLFPARLPGGSAPRSLLPARLLSGALRREENRRILAGSRRSRTGARPHPRPAPSRWLQSASRLHPGGGEGGPPGVAKGSGSRERRSLTYFPWRQAPAYLRAARRPGGSRGIARAGCSRPEPGAGRAQGGAAWGGGLELRDPPAGPPSSGVPRADPATLALAPAALESCFGAPSGASHKFMDFSITERTH